MQGTALKAASAEPKRRAKVLTALRSSIWSHLLAQYRIREVTQCCGSVAVSTIELLYHTPIPSSSLSSLHQDELQHSIQSSSLNNEGMRTYWCVEGLQSTSSDLRSTESGVLIEPSSLGPTLMGTLTLDGPTVPTQNMCCKAEKPSDIRALLKQSTPPVRLSAVHTVRRPYLTMQYPRRPVVMTPHAGFAKLCALLSRNLRAALSLSNIIRSPSPSQLSQKFKRQGNAGSLRDKKMPGFSAVFVGSSFGEPTTTGYTRRRTTLCEKRQTGANIQAAIGSLCGRQTS